MRVLDEVKTAENIDRYCKAIAKSNRIVAEKLGVSTQAVYQWRMGTKKPTVENVCRMTEVFNCNLDDIIVMVDI